MTGRELVIVGAGPAGVSAALWARLLDLDVLLLEAGEGPGGQLHHIHFQPREIPGWTAGDGAVMAATYARQLAESGIVVRYGAVAAALTPGDPPSLTLADGGTVVARAMLVATGARRRRLGVPGEEDFADRGLSYSATRDLSRLTGRRLVVVGGGDAAYENALILAAAGRDVTLLVRGVSRARVEFRERVAADSRIRVRTGATVRAVLGDERVRALRVAEPDGERDLPCDGVVVKVGVVPNTEWCRGALAHDPDGWLTVDASFATSGSGVWAAGDVTRPLLPGIPVSHGHGALAVAAIRHALRGD